MRPARAPLDFPGVSRPSIADCRYTSQVDDRALRIGPGPVDLAELVSLVSAGEPDRSGAHGAVVTFLGTVRRENQGRRVRHLEYEAFEPLALKTFATIRDEVRERWPSARVAFHHRVGRVELGQVSVGVAASSPHRAEAFAACRYVIERIKQIAPVWKREFFEGGEVWIEGATADPSDPAAREEAYRRACM
jgi:molybdopterin synthase catalytic subunit